MMSNDPLSGPKLKIRWLNRRIGELDQICEAYFAESRYDLVVEPDPASGDRLAKVKITEPVPDALYMSVGEVAYHMRSSLDQMIVAIGRENGIVNTRHLSFPFTREYRDFESRSTQDRLRGLPADVCEMIRQLQPFESGDERLWGLGLLANIDKHNTLVPVNTSADVRLIEGFKITRAKTAVIVGSIGRLDEGIVISNLGTDGTIEAGKSSRFHVFGDIVFGDMEVFKGKPVSRTLHELAQQVEDIVRAFDRHCFGQQRGEG